MHHHFLLELVPFLGDGLELKKEKNSIIFVKSKIVPWQQVTVRIVPMKILEQVTPTLDKK